MDSIGSDAKFGSQHTMNPKEQMEFGPSPPTKQFVLCFDGTGNKFAGDESDTNLVKIYRVRFFPPLDFFWRLLTRSIE